MTFNNPSAAKLSNVVGSKHSFPREMGLTESPAQRSRALWRGGVVSLTRKASYE